MRKWLNKLSILPLAIVISLFLFLLFERLRGQISLARFKSELAAKGENLSAADFALPVSKGENGVPTIVEAMSQLKPGPILPESVPQKMELLPSGHAVVGFREIEWVFDKKTNSWEALALEWNTNQSTLQRIRDALEKPMLNNELNYSLGHNLVITNLSFGVRLAKYFGAGSQLSLHNGLNHEAMGRLLPQIRLPRLVESDRLGICELVRSALASIAKYATWEALQSKGWTDADLGKMQTAWESQEFINSAIAGFQGELVYEAASYKLLRNSNDDTFKVLFEWRNILSDENWEPPAWEQSVSGLPFGDHIVNFLQKQIFCRIWRFAWSHQHQLRSARQIHQLLEVSRTLAKGQSFSGVHGAIEQFTQDTERRNFYDSFRFPESPGYLMLANPINKAARAQTERSASLCAIALQRFALRDGKFPASLEFLVPEFLPSVPIDYCNGKPMKYFLNPDESFTLYSVGEDGEDNRGDSSLIPGKIGRSVWNRKDAIWPKPASSEEVAAFRREKTGK